MFKVLQQFLEKQVHYVALACDRSFVLKNLGVYTQVVSLELSSDICHHDCELLVELIAEHLIIVAWQVHISANASDVIKSDGYGF